MSAVPGGESPSLRTLPDRWGSAIVTEGVNVAAAAPMIAIVWDGAAWMPRWGRTPTTGSSSFLAIIVAPCKGAKIQ